MNKYFKMLLASLMTFVLLFAFVGCVKDDTDNGKDDDSTQSEGDNSGDNSENNNEGTDTDIVFENSTYADFMLDISNITTELMTRIMLGQMTGASCFDIKGTTTADNVEYLYDSENAVFVKNELKYVQTDRTQLNLTAELSDSFDINNFDPTSINIDKSVMLSVSNMKFDEALDLDDVYSSNYYVDGNLYTDEYGYKSYYAFSPTDTIMQLLTMQGGGELTTINDDANVTVDNSTMIMMLLSLVQQLSPETQQYIMGYYLNSIDFDEVITFEKATVSNKEYILKLTTDEVKLLKACDDLLDATYSLLVEVGENAQDVNSENYDVSIEIIDLILSLVPSTMSTGSVTTYDALLPTFKTMIDDTKDNLVDSDDVSIDIVCEIYVTNNLITKVTASNLQTSTVENFGSTDMEMEYIIEYPTTQTIVAPSDLDEYKELLMYT